MNDIRTLDPARRQAAWPGTPAGPATAPRRLSRLARLPGLIAIWRERMRLRRELEQKAKDDPHLIEDMGLKRWQVEAEIAKPFWQP